MSETTSMDTEEIPRASNGADGPSRRPRLIRETKHEILDICTGARSIRLLKIPPFSLSMKNKPKERYKAAGISQYADGEKFLVIHFLILDSLPVALLQVTGADSGGAPGLYLPRSGRDFPLERG